MVICLNISFYFYFFIPEPDYDPPDGSNAFGQMVHITEIFFY
jgi:hypothetical protein